MAEEQNLTERINRIWDDFDQAGRIGQLSRSRHELHLKIDDVGAGWEYVSVDLDLEKYASYRVSTSIGPGVRELVKTVFSAGNGRAAEFIWYGEPGTYSWVISRKGSFLYMEIPGIDGGYFFRYFQLRNSLLQDYEAFYGWGYKSCITRIFLSEKEYGLLESVDGLWDVFELVRLLPDIHSFETTDVDAVIAILEERILESGMENGVPDEYGNALKNLCDTVCAGCTPLPDPELKLSECTAADVPRLALLNKCLIEDEKSDNPMSIPQLEERMQGFLDDGYRAFLIMLDETAAGYALVRVSSKPCYLRQFYIGRDFRRRHLGEKAFRALLDLLGEDTIDVDVLTANKAGMSFWKSLGFCERYVSMRFER